jgi:hypothetical protein
MRPVSLFRKPYPTQSRERDHVGIAQELADRLIPVAQIIGDAGGEIVGRTKLQKRLIC